tara:strand:- start:247 stop:465 length:219 start_codon:yes stop_codon:yes gene_type:complete
MSSLSNERLNKIARNINAMDVNFEYSDDMKVYKFWRNLKRKLDSILQNLTDADKSLIITLCEEDKRKYFNLI